MAFKFEKAVKSQSKLRLALSGPSGSGKTHSALLIMRGIVGDGGRIAVIDTENGRASLKVGEPNIPDFERARLDPPYTVERYLDAIHSAVKAGFDGLIIDSVSHEWVGDGGILSRKEAIDARGGNSFANWAQFSKEHEKFKAALLAADVHLIVTMRSKQDYVLEQNERGKQTPRKIGLAPIQREGMEYEMSFHFDIAMNHEVKVLKSDFAGFDNATFVPTVETGRTLVEWLNTGKPVEKPAAEPTIEDRLNKAAEAFKGRGWTAEQLKELTSEAESDEAILWILTEKWKEINHKQEVA